MITYKTKEEIALMREGGKRLRSVMEEVKNQIKPGKTTLEVDRLIEHLIIKAGGKASFKMVPDYYHASCLCVNDCVVHGIPTDYRLKASDILGIDIGMFYRGFNTDMAETIYLKEGKSDHKDKEIIQFLKIGKLALCQAIKKAVVGNRIGDISKTIQEVIEKNGYSVVKKLVGHGVGRKLHEDPQIPGILSNKRERTESLKEGMTLAIEVIYNQGKPEIVYKNQDGWTIITEDRNLSGLFEETIAIIKTGPQILTG